MPSTMRDAPQAASTRPRVTCRAIRTDDLLEVVDLLDRGFPVRDKDYWRRGLAHQAFLKVPQGFPQFGYVLAAGDELVGVLLTIYSELTRGERTYVRCNLSSWYVEPAYRIYATLLDRIVVRDRTTTFTNLSPAPHTVAMHEARGFERFVGGGVLAMPALQPGPWNIRITTVQPDEGGETLPAAERELLRDHSRYGCICLVATRGSQSAPFVFRRRPPEAIRWRLGWSPVSYGHLIYCRSLDDLSRFGGAIGRHLMIRHGLPAITFDAEAPVAGVPGLFQVGRVRLKKGPAPIEPGDLAYSELALYGP